MRDLWLQNLDWDDPVPESTLVHWRKHCTDLKQLFSIDIQRCCLNQDKVYSLCLFCDAPKSCYGFTVYGIFDGRAHLLYAKSTVIPSKAKTLPTLELLAVYLALNAYLSFWIHLNILVLTRSCVLWILKLCYSGCLLVLFLTKMSSLVTALKTLPCTEITLKEILELILGSNMSRVRTTHSIYIHVG